jgi:carboxyl-terminal processing protease
MKWLIRFSAILIVLLGCGKDPIVEDPSEGEVYLNDVLSFMETNSVNRNSINWTEFRNSVFQKAPNLKSIPQTQQAIETALKLLNDHHSYYKSGNIIFYDANVCTWITDYPNPKLLPSSIGYLRVGGFIGTQAEGLKFAESLQTVIKNQDNSDLTGWIVDLRGNIGGDMVPMLAGIGPILNDSVAGYFIFPEGKINSYGYKNGKVYNTGFSQMAITNPYSLINPKPKVAVLIDGANSAGEAVTGAFSGRPNTKLFGSISTCGRTTALIGTTLSDGALLAVANCWMADRNSKIFKGPIFPDQISKDDNTAIQDAIDWLLK